MGRLPMHRVGEILDTPGGIRLERHDQVHSGVMRLFFFSSRRRHTRCSRDWSSDVCSSDLHSKNVGALCTHGYANADFVDSSAERVGHDAVDADGSQEKSNAGEDAEEFKSKAPLRKESGNHSLHGAEDRKSVV